MHEFLARHEAELIEQLVGWIRLRSVAGLPERAPDLLRSAHWLAGALRAVGFPVVDIWKVEGAPAVYAEWCAAPGAPTVLVYSHHDVRAAKDDEWEETPPFEPAVRDGYVFGRGASDAKGQIIAHLWGVRAHLHATGREAPAVNLKFLVEGEEETGSGHLADLLAEHRDRLGADLVVFSDTLMWRADHPAVCTSIRGLVSARLEVRGPLRDVHSGAVSGPAPNPVLALARLIGDLHDKQGRVTLPGFYDNVTGPSERRRAELAALPFTEEDWLARSETRSANGEAGFTVLEQLWARPAAEVLSLLAGDPVGAARGAIPSAATAGFSIRTVAGQRATDVAEQLRRWVEANLGDHVDYELSIPEKMTGDAYESPEDHPAVLALAAAMEDGFGRPAGRMGNAGGGPAELLARTLDAPLVFFGTGLPEDRWHDSDERVSVAMLVNGAATLAHFWDRLSRSR
ncbi:M20/M25/M40 family metallo-hydrolase [Dactylosporangium sp. NPDC051541]|uniref:M20/M25/M40 family metallo-hydrolase n=1 Tax=Dactylosporangium sp. NPDC051541 TaxID=3363977 RepID=UPI003791372E